MINLVQFPGLGLELEVPRVALTLFGIDIYWYGVIIVSGLILAVAFAYTQCLRFGVDRDFMLDAVMVGLVLALIGGRLYYIISSDTKTLADFFDFRGGGIAIYGGIIGAFIGGAIVCKWRKMRMLPLFDLVGMGFLIGQGIGRWGNFFNQEAFGTNTTLPWGMYSETTHNFLQYRQAALAAEGVIVDPSMPVHPTFLYESIWCLVGFLALFLYRKHRRFNGEIMLMYIGWYGLGRFFIEALRTDALVGSLLGLRVSQVLAGVSFVATLAIWIYIRVKKRGVPLEVPKLPDHTMAVRVLTSSGEQTVNISWPANTKAPTKNQREDMARLVLKADKLKDAEAQEKAEADEETTAQEEPDEQETE